MNRVFLIGRLVADPEIRYSQANLAISRYRLAVDRRVRKEGEQSADFISCVAFGKSAEFAEKYLHKGTKIAVVGRIQTGSYTNKSGVKVYTTDIIIDEQEFAESKGTGNGDAAGGGRQAAQTGNESANEAGDGFMNVPDDYEGLPFN